MLYARSTFLGIDIPINQFQTYLYPILKNKWNITNDSAYDSYSRCNVTQTNDGFIPEMFISGTSNEYKEVLFDDTKSAVSFFYVNPNIKYNAGTATATVSLIFTCNMQQLQPAVTDSFPDEIIHINVQQACGYGKYGFFKTNFTTGFKDVFKEFTGTRIKDGIKFRDMSPLHCFRIDFKLIYPINACQTTPYSNIPKG